MRKFSDILASYAEAGSFSPHRKQSKMFDNDIPPSAIVVPDPPPKVLEALEKVPALKKHRQPQPSALKETLDELPIESFQDYASPQDAIFLRRMETMGRLGDGSLRNLPQQADVMRYIVQKKESEQPPWVKRSQAAIINSESLSFPRLDVLTRTYLTEFLRQPTVDKGERPCGHSECESVAHGGFRLRELLLPSEVASPPAIVGWCYLCHLRETILLYLERFNAKDEHSHPANDQIHDFIVMVDSVGEYRLDKCITGDDHVNGIYGPVPIYNRNYYHATQTKTGLRGYVESDTLVFRLSQTVPNPTESSHTIQMGTTGSSLTQSSHVGSAAASSRRQP
jgi:hypothetical protein